MGKKVYICVVITLILMIFIQLIFFHNKTKKNKNKNSISYNQNYITEDNVKSLKVYPINEDKVFEVYKGPTTKTDLEEMVYQLLFGNIPWINKNYSNMTLNEINNYYKQNTIAINRLYIYSSDDFYLITQQIKNAYKDGNPAIDNTKIEENSIKNEGVYCSFNLDIYFSNSQTIKLKIKLKNSQENNNKQNNNNENGQNEITTSEDEKSIIIEDNSEIQQLYKIANEGFDRAKVIETIENIINEVKNIKEDTYAYSINKEKQYYDLHKEDLNELGIYSSDDFVEFIGSVKKISWNDQDKITGYSIDTSSLITGTDYTTADLYINYGNIERIALKISVSNKINIVPQIRIK